MRRDRRAAHGELKPAAGGYTHCGRGRWRRAFAVGGLQPAARVAIVPVLWLSAQAALHACPICFQVEDGPVADGVRAAVLVLVAVTGAVLAAFGVFAGRLWRRAAARTPEPESRNLP